MHAGLFGWVRDQCQHTRTHTHARTHARTHTHTAHTYVNTAMLCTCSMSCLSCQYQHPLCMCMCARTHTREACMHACPGVYKGAPAQAVHRRLVSHALFERYLFMPSLSHMSVLTSVLCVHPAVCLLSFDCCGDALWPGFGAGCCRLTTPLARRCCSTALACTPPPPRPCAHT